MGPKRLDYSNQWVISPQKLGFRQIVNPAVSVYTQTAIDGTRQSIEINALVEVAV